MPAIRISLMRCRPEHFAGLRQLMAESAAALEPIRQLRGLVHFYAGESGTANALVNVSIWHTLEDAKQLDTFQPMLDLGKVFVSKGAIFERPIVNYASQWEISAPK